MSQPIVFQRLDELLDRVEVVETIIDSGGGDGELVIPIGSQIQAGILRLATDSEVQGDNNVLAATAGQVAGAKTAAAIANAGVSTVSARVDALENAGEAEVTLSPTGGIHDTTDGLGIKLNNGGPVVVVSASGLYISTAGLGLQAAYANANNRGSVRTTPESMFADNNVSTADYYVPQASAHQALYNRVTTVESSLGDVSAALAAFLRI